MSNRPDRAARLEASRQAPVVRARPPRRRPLAAAALVGALAIAWLVVGHQPHRAETPVEPTTISTATTTIAVTSRVVGGMRVDMWQPSNVAVFYALHAGAPGVAARGPARCATNHADERAWSRPQEPTRVVGRYRCRIEHGRAAMWWSNDRGVVAHAVASDANLSALFRWWLAHTDVG